MASQLEHIAIVMDGNGRWAQKKRQPRIMGHRAGAKVLPDIVSHAQQSGLRVLTLFAFSLDNHQRPESEVNDLMHLFSEALKKDISRLQDQNICLRIIGDHHRFDVQTQRLMSEAIEATAANTGMTLVVALNYSGRWDIAQAAQRAARDVEAGIICSEEINMETYAQYLSCADLPDPDLLIRTSGEQRISNFLLWQLAYAELYFSSVYWPDFTIAEYDKAVSFYQTRERRFGSVSQQLVGELDA